MATGSKIIKIDMIIEIDQYFFSFEPGLVSTSGPGPGQRCNGYLKVHKRNGFEEQNIELKMERTMAKLWIPMFDMLICFHSVIYKTEIHFL